MKLYWAINAGLHIIAIILLSGALCSENFLFRRGMNADDVKKLLIADAVHAGALVLIIITGLSYILVFNHNAAFNYSQNLFFIAKLVMFAIVVCCSLYPSYTFQRWRKAVRLQRPSLISYHQQRMVSRFIRLELYALLIIPVLVELARAGYGQWTN
ncbi:MAG: hypothetical protein CENE_01774 [Candidatus Celerinatantimonas neptuna]|nr:MAG: hypothetical protein CENE_01774 [Candidatus Celerinatantimonas neptuna]